MRPGSLSHCSAGAYPDLVLLLNHLFALTATDFFLGKSRQNRLLLGSAPSGFLHCGIATGQRGLRFASSPTSRACAIAQGVLRPRPFAIPQRSLPDVAICGAYYIFILHVYKPGITNSTCTNTKRKSDIDCDVREAERRRRGGGCAKRNLSAAQARDAGEPANRRPRAPETAPKRGYPKGPNRGASGFPPLPRQRGSP